MSEPQETVKQQGASSPIKRLNPQNRQSLQGRKSSKSPRKSPSASRRGFLVWGVATVAVVLGGFYAGSNWGRRERGLRLKPGTETTELPSTPEDFAAEDDAAPEIVDEFLPPETPTEEPELTE